MTTSYAEAPVRARTPAARYRHSLWLLTKRDLRVRYSTSALGYVWSILDPLLMAGIYFFVFVVIFHRGGVGEDPYIVFLITALLPWVWFNGSASECARAFLRESRLIRSTTIPRSIWVNRIVLSKGIEFLASLPVLAVFVVLFGARVGWEALYCFPLAIVMQAAFTVGFGLIVAPLVVFFRDLERVVKLLLRVFFYASPVVYSAIDVPEHLRPFTALNPLTGIFSLYRSAFFPGQLDWNTVAVAAVVTLVTLGVGVVVFSRSQHAVLKEI